MFLHSWVLFPVVAFLLCVGCGLLVDRIAGRPLPGALVAPVGMAAVVVIASFLTWPKATAPLTPWALGVAAVAGYVVGRRRLQASLRRWRHAIWPGVAAVLPAGMMSLPVLVTGKAGFTGYGRIVDLAYQIAWAELRADRRPGQAARHRLVVQRDRRQARGDPLPRGRRRRRSARSRGARASTSSGRGSRSWPASARCSASRCTSC